MKQIFTLCILMILSFQLNSQVPHGFNYQGVARDDSGVPMPNANISLQISLYSDDPSGSLVFQETHSVITSNLGLFQLVIGKGEIQEGTIEDIEWGSSDHYLEIALDDSGGTNYSVIGSTQLWSVPYALHSGNGSKWSVQTNGISYEDGAVGIGINETNPSAILELNSENSGLLLPRVDLIESTDQNPLEAHVEGMMVYNTNTINDVKPGVYINDGTKWINISSILDLLEAQSQQIENLQNSSPIKRAVFVAGQSNTTWGSGSAQIPDWSDKNIFQLGRNEVNLQEVPLTFYGAYHHSILASGGNFGSVFMNYYYDQLQTEFPNREIQLLMVPCGAGGSGWAASQFPANSWRTDAAYYSDLIQRIKWAKNNGYQIDAFLWHQGETDALNQTINYKDILYNFIQSVRDFVDNEELPFVLGEMVPSWVAPDPNLVSYQELLNEVKDEIPFTGIASGENLTLADVIHYDAEAHVELGKRYYDQYLLALDNSAPQNFNETASGEYLLYNFDSSSGETFPTVFSAIRFGDDVTDNRYSTLGDIWKYKNEDGYHFKVEVVSGQGIEGETFEWKQKYNPFGLSETNFQDRASFEIINNSVGIDPNSEQRFASLVFDGQTDVNFQWTLFHADVRAFNNFWYFPIGQVANFGNLIPLIQSNNTVSHIRMYMVKE